jgi:hypothetical protein
LFWPEQEQLLHRETPVMLVALMPVILARKKSSKTVRASAKQAGAVLLLKTMRARVSTVNPRLARLIHASAQGVATDTEIRMVYAECIV